LQELGLEFTTRTAIMLSGDYFVIGQGISLFLIGMVFAISLANYQ